VVVAVAGDAGVDARAVGEVVSGARAAFEVLAEAEAVVEVVAEARAVVVEWVRPLDWESECLGLD